MRRPFDPDAAAAPASGAYGLDPPADGAAAQVVRVPFDATTSYRKGAAHGPAAILRASRQVELHDPVFGRVWEAGLHLRPLERRVEELQRAAAPLAERVIEAGGDPEGDPALLAALESVNAIGAELNGIVEAEAAAVLDRGALPAIVGGDHAVPLGAWRAAARRSPGLGLLHVDAHADLRVAFEGFAYSHASVMHNALAELDIARLVQVGLRDLGEAELARIESEGDRVHVVADRDWAEARLAGRDLRAIAREAIERLPRAVWLTVDVDGLDPTLCPSTGTPVPGGLSWHEIGLWIEELATSGRRVVGVDLVEVSPGPELGPIDGIDAIVGARLLYRMIGAALATRAVD